MIPDSVAWALLALVILCLGTAIWLNNRFPPFPPAPEFTPEAPAVPRKLRPGKALAVKDRLAWRDAHPDAVETITRRLHAREVQELDQGTRL